MADGLPSHTRHHGHFIGRTARDCNARPLFDDVWQRGNLRSILCTLCRRRRAVVRLAVLRIDQVAAQEPLLIVRRSRSPHDDKHYREPRRLGRRRPRDIVCRPWPGTAHGTVSSQGRLLATRAART